MFYFDSKTARSIVPLYCDRFRIEYNTPETDIPSVCSKDAYVHDHTFNYFIV